MKKLITLFVALTLSFTVSHAQHYRGFADLTVSMPVTKMDGGKLSYEDTNGVLLGVTTSHGVQLKRFFIGAGIGGFVMPGGSGIGLPLFVDGRYDFFSVSKANLFIGCKLGYMPWLGANDGLTLLENDEADVMYGKLSGLYCNPSIGVRFRLTGMLGLNIALSYLPLSLECTYKNPYFENSYQVGDKFTDHRLMLTVGIDF